MARVSSIRAANGLPGHQVSYLLEDRAGKLWVGVDDGLYLSREWAVSVASPNRIIGRLEWLLGLTEDIDGNIWAECASKPRKLVRIRDFRVRRSFLRRRFPPARIAGSGSTRGNLDRHSKRRRSGCSANGALEPKFPLNPDAKIRLPIAR